MPALSRRAADLLDLMESGRRYGASELRQLAPDLSAEALADLMRELWIDRQVERCGYSGWQRVRSTPGAHEAPPASPRPVKIVKPQELFDHDAFAGLFK